MKLLIIDDKSKMVELVQKQFYKLNAGFDKNNTFLFQISNETGLEIKTYDSIAPLKDCPFSGYTKEEVLKKIDSLLDHPQYKSELFFIVIDMCLKKDIIGNFDIADYYEYKEICADIYRHLIERKNTSLKGRNILFAIYSRSETFVSVISKVLQEQYKIKHSELNLKINDDINDFPYASCEAQNISWFTNLWRPNDNSSEQKVSNNYPLNLPGDLCDYIKTLKD